MNFLKQNFVSIAILFLGFSILILSYTVAIGFEKLDNNNQFLIEDCDQVEFEEIVNCELSNKAKEITREKYVYNFGTFLKELFKGL